MNASPRCCSSWQNYHELADVKIPRESPVLSKTVKSRKVSPSTSSDSQLYRLKVIENDDTNGRVKVRYIGYEEEYDEWKLLEDSVELSESSSIDEASSVTAISLSVGKFCLYKELSYQVKALLCSSRKGNPLCQVVMSFDIIYFEELIHRGMKLCSTGQS